MDEKRKNLQTEYEALTKQLAEPSIFTTPEGQKVAKRHADVEKLLTLFDNVDSLRRNVADTKEMAKSDDAEMADLATTELPELETALQSAELELETALVPKDPQDEKPAIIEIRAGAGGDEASLFAGELMRMYMKYAETKRWKTELLTESASDVGGFKEVSFKIDSPGAYGELKYESGVHRVQRVPETESGGRTHTSTVTVAVLPEAEEHDIEINPADLRIDVFRSSGPGGQSVNTTDSAVRITHAPTGVTVVCQDEKSQHKNKEKALSILRSRLLAAKLEADQQARSDQRKSQIGSGDRSEKIRTYNFPQDRLTDHRIGLTTHGLPATLEGDIGGIISKLQAADLELKKQADHR